MRLLSLAATLLAVGAASTAFAQQNESLNYNIVNVQAEATREVSNDQMHAVLYIEKSHKQPAELASQINQLMSQAIATARKYPQVKVETGSQTTYPIYDNDSRKLKEWRGRAEVAPPRPPAARHRPGGEPLRVRPHRRGASPDGPLG